MVIYLHDLFPLDDFRANIDAGYVNVQTHPTLPLSIANYSHQAQYDHAWNSVTTQCRGLIYDSETLVVVARPFPKFFNLGELSDLDIPAVPFRVLEKLDGCFPRHTTLNLWNGGTVRIEKVVRDRLPVTLVGMKDGRMVPALVTDWHRNGRKDKWLDIEVSTPVSRLSGSRGCPNRLRVTPNHRIYLNGEYRPASEARPGDRIISQTWRPSESTLRLIQASMLGDGCLTRPATKKDVARYQENHCKKQREYMLAIQKALGTCGSHRADTISGFGSRMVWAGSREYAILGEIRDKWYPEGIKRVPEDISWLDDFSVAKWYMDDGTRQRFAKQADRAGFSTHSFAFEDVVRLGDHLSQRYGITYHIVKDRGWSLVLNSGRKLDTFWAAIAPYIHPSMRYKLPERWQEEPYIEMEVGYEECIPLTATVTSVEDIAPTKRNFPSGCTGFDVTTTTGNYLARGVLVHNSLGVLYPDSYPAYGSWAVATRGSFTSDQAIHATAVLKSRYLPRFVPDPAYTYLFEIIYPENRIVVDYGNMDDLILLEVLSTATHARINSLTWPGSSAYDHTMSLPTLAHVLASNRTDAEGYVLRFDNGMRVKVKHNEYTRLHRILTGVSSKVIWEYLSASRSLDPIIDAVPDEFYAWVKYTADSLLAAYEAIESECRNMYESAVKISMSDPESPRRGFARAVMGFRYAAVCFLMLDGHDYSEYMWKQVRPAYERPFRADEAG